MSVFVIEWFSDLSQFVWPLCSCLVEIVSGDDSVAFELVDTKWMFFDRLALLSRGLILYFSKTVSAC